MAPGFRLHDARHGGEELIILLPDSKETGALSFAEKLHAIARMPVTASFGVAKLLPGDSGVDAGLARADAALYAAKNSGTNWVKSFTTVAQETGKLSA